MAVIEKSSSDTSWKGKLKKTLKIMSIKKSGKAPLGTSLKSRRLSEKE